MEPHGQARACTPKCHPWPSFSIGVTARRRGLLRRRMKPRKELHIIQGLPRNGNIPTCDGRDATNLFRPREDIVPGIQHSVTEIIEVG